MTLSDDVAEIRTLLAKATPGPCECGCGTARNHRLTDAVFRCLPALLDEREAMRRLLRECSYELMECKAILYGVATTHPDPKEKGA